MWVLCDQSLLQQRMSTRFLGCRQDGAICRQKCRQKIKNLQLLVDKGEDTALALLEGLSDNYPKWVQKNSAVVIMNDKNGLGGSWTRDLSYYHVKKFVWKLLAMFTIRHRKEFDDRYPGSYIKSSSWGCVVAYTIYSVCVDVSPE